MFCFVYSAVDCPQLIVYMLYLVRCVQFAGYCFVASPAVASFAAVSALVAARSLCDRAYSDFAAWYRLIHEASICGRPGNTWPLFAVL